MHKTNCALTGALREAVLDTRVPIATTRIWVRNVTVGLFQRPHGQDTCWRLEPCQAVSCN